MAAPPPTSVLLPTTRWTNACREVADQLRVEDELVVICDDESDPVADHAHGYGDDVHIVIAGEPDGCSGKANAIAAGMAAARHERLVWTDDDFHHPPDWLATLTADYDRRGPVSEVPFFVGADPLALLLEPIYAIATLGIYLDDEAWGGAVVFERDDIEEDAFLDDLQRTVTDDLLLTEYLDVTAVRRTHTVAIGGSIRESVERHVRWQQSTRWHDSGGPVSKVVVSGLFAAGAILFPIPAAALLTVLHLGINEALGERRWTPVLAYPAMLAQFPLLVYAFARRSFAWGGRRYRWDGKFEVSIVE